MIADKYVYWWIELKLTIHLEHVHIEVGQVELPLTPLEEGVDVLAAPDAWVGGQRGGQVLLVLQKG